MQVARFEPRSHFGSSLKLLQMLLGYRASAVLRYVVLCLIALHIQACGDGGADGEVPVGCNSKETVKAVQAYYHSMANTYWEDGDFCLKWKTSFLLQQKMQSASIQSRTRIQSPFWSCKMNDISIIRPTEHDRKEDPLAW